MQKVEGRAFQAEGIATENAKEWELTWGVRGTE